MAQVFISYDREDRDFAEVVQAKLEKAGHATVMDSDVLHAGDDWQDRLDASIRRSQALVVIMTPEARASDYVAYEWAFALGAGVKVIPLELKPTSFSARLDALHRLDFTDRTRPWDTLLAEIRQAEQANPLSSIEVAAGAPAPVKQAARGVDSPEASERAAAIRTLAQTDHPAARAALVQALQHSVSDVRAAAALLFPDRTDARTVPGLIDALRARTAEGGNPHDFVSRVAGIGPAATPALLRALSEDDSPRIAIVEALGHVGDGADVPALSELLQEPDADGRRAAAAALGRIGDVDASPALRVALGDAVAHVRAAAVDALGSLKVAASVPELTRLLDEDVSAVRAAAARALGAIGDPATIPLLIQALGDGDDGVRHAAILALAGFHDRAAVAPLRRLLEAQGATEFIRDSDSALMLVLLQLEDAESLPLIEKRLTDFRSGYFGQVEEMCERMSRLGEAGLAVVLRVLAGARSGSVREQAAKALAGIDAPEAAAALREWRRSQS